MEGVTNILVVDDDPNVHETLEPWLAREGYTIVSAFDGKEALSLSSSRVPNLIVLDVMLPGMDGVSVCLEFNQRLPKVPILMLSARDDVLDRVVGLESGADDYVPKPFHPREVVTRIKALLRRIRKFTESRSTETETLELGRLRLEPKAYRAYVDEKLQSLTTTEFELLLALVEHPDVVNSRQSLLDSVWGADFFGSERTVDSHIRNLRRKLTESAPEYDPIESVRGVGYRFRS